MALEGLDKALKNINRQIAKIKNVSVKEMREIGMDLHSKSAELAPVDTGDLRGSGYDYTGKLNGEIVTEVGFKQVYAVVQHENLEFNHPQGGEAKYLEKPLKKNTRRYVERLAKASREVNK
jgi:hypothetical protein